MSTTSQDLAKRVLRREWERLSALERTVIERVLQRIPISRNVNAELRDARTTGERLADGLAAFGGSWTFIVSFLMLLVAWVILNTEILGPQRHAFDPYPYVFLNLILSMLAALQAPVILMSQNRQAERDRMNATHDYEVNLKAELEVRMLDEKIDRLREAQWEELVEMQRQQIQMLERLLALRLSS